MRTRGYSLIEVLAAMAIFALAIGGIMALLHSASSSAGMCVHRVRMSLLARTVMDEARLAGRLGKEPEPLVEAGHPLFPGYNYDVEVFPLDYYGREHLLHVVIRWYRPIKAAAPKTPAKPKTKGSKEQPTGSVVERAREHTEPHVSFDSIIFVEE